MSSPIVAKEILSVVKNLPQKPQNSNGFPGDFYPTF